MFNKAPTPMTTTALASMLLATATGQNVIFVPSLLGPLSSHEPPCRQRRLEPFRQNIRDSCRAETSSCSVSSKDRSLEEALGLFPSDVRYLLDGFPAVPPSSLSTIGFDGYLWDQVFDDMMRQSMAIFDAMLVRDGLSSSLSMDRGDSRESSEEKNGEVATVELKRQEAEQAAEQALDVMVTSLVSNLKNEVPKTDKVENQGQEIAHRLSQMGNDLLMKTHRRLAELSPSDAVDPHMAVQQRLARRLTEYSVDMFFHPDGTVSLYTTSMPSPPEDYVPVLGSGSKDVDQCVYSRYENGDLEKDCHEAVDLFMTALSTPGMQYGQLNTKSSAVRALNQKSQHIQPNPPFVGDYQASLMILLIVYTLIAIVGLCTGLIDSWTFAMGIVLSVSVGIWGFASLIVSLPICLLVDRFLLSESDGDEEDAKEKSDEMDEYDYVKLADSEVDKGENRVDDAVKQSQTLVFVGVPVHVV
eukprot:CCRYP_015899-RA/>CCRYP_015899-RA protein AED:0.07 eAED:0.07 QI:251/1/1/1/0.5/0.33/3/126/470